MIEPSFSAPPRILPLICLLLTAGLLVAGLSPFNPFPKNDVRWVPGGGLAFGDRGMAYGTSPVVPRAASMNTATVSSAAAALGEGDSSCGLQIRIQPAVVFLNNSATVLDIYAAENPLKFRLMQWRDELLIRRDYFDNSQHLKTAELELANAFLGEEPVTFTIIAGPKSTVAFRNGQKAGTSSRLELSCADFAGQLLLGEAPIQDNPWSGKVFELELFRENTGADRQSPSSLAAPTADSGADSTADSRADSTAGQARPAAINNSVPFAGYTFREGSGQTAHNSVAAGPDLLIPEIFVVLHKQLLLPPWKELDDKLTVRDIAINVVGFMPFGFLVFAYFHLQRRWPRAAVLTVLAGFAISATIEVLQAYIPSRTSGVLDIITNTLGTGLGMWLFHWRPLQVFASKLRFYELPKEAAQK